MRDEGFDPNLDLTPSLWENILMALPMEEGLSFKGAVVITVAVEDETGDLLTDIRVNPPQNAGTILETVMPHIARMYNEL